MLPPTVNARGKIDNRLRAVWRTKYFQAWPWTNSATLVLRTGIIVCRSAGFELVQGDERIVAIFRYWGLPALMVPEPHQYDQVRDKFVGIEQKDLSAIYGPRQRGLVFVLQAQQQVRRRYSFIDTLVGWLSGAIPAVKSGRSVTTVYLGCNSV